MDRITAVKAFIGVADQGSFSGAARAQGVSPSLVTKYVQSLEEMLGTTLFQRSTRRVVLTEAGQIYRRHWRKILSDIEAADAAVDAEQHEIRGNLRLGAPAAIGRMVVAPLAVGFSRAHQEVAIDLIFNNALTEPQSGDLDILFRVGRPPAWNLTAITARRLATFPMIICASPDYLEAHGAPRSAEDLSSHACVHRIPAGQTGTNPWRFFRDGEMIEVPTNGSIRANTADAVISAALHGQGLIYQPAYIVRDYLATGRLLAVTIDVQTTELPLFAFWQSDRHMPARIGAFIDYCATQLEHVNEAGGTTGAMMGA